jgi:hypothetical protein
MIRADDRRRCPAKHNKHRLKRIGRALILYVKAEKIFPCVYVRVLW